MPHDHDEILRRTLTALNAIKSAYGQPGHEEDVTLFVEHHLDELNESYWQQHFGNSRPNPERVLDLLELQSHWGDEDDEGIDTFDFTLPGEVTDYVISVRFDESGAIEGIDMES